MKKVYSKPEINVERFAVDMAVAQSCDRLESGETTVTYEPQTVNCVLTSSDTIFMTGTTGCTHGVSLTGGGTTWDFVNYKGTLYFCWVGPSAGRGSDEGMELLRAILKEGNINNGNAQINGSSNVWHAGPAIGNIINLMTASY